MGSSNTDRTKSVKRVINRLAYSTLTSQLIHHTLGESPVDYSYEGEYYDDKQDISDIVIAVHYDSFAKEKGDYKC
jgi:hypothetical protein